MKATGMAETTSRNDIPKTSLLNKIPNLVIDKTIPM